jgi:hypothetical protein
MKTKTKIRKLGPADGRSSNIAARFEKSRQLELKLQLELELELELEPKL